MRTPCKNCPFRRKSLPGYLGEMTYQPDKFIHTYTETNTKMPCHMKVDWDLSKQEVQEQADRAPICSGFAVVCKNSAKLPINRDSVEAINHALKDSETYFSNMNEFCKHHSYIEDEDLQFIVHIQDSKGKRAIRCKDKGEVTAALETMTLGALYQVEGCNGHDASEYITF